MNGGMLPQTPCPRRRWPHMQVELLARAIYDAMCLLRMALPVLAQGTATYAGTLCCRGQANIDGEDY
jgi:hypothetical protein